MARWQPESRTRLEQAALDLYVEKGFESTTVAEIAEHAGLTERTFFRHFADKREVLFLGADAFQSVFIDAIAASDPSVSPMDAIGAAVQAAGEMLQQRRDHSRRRQVVIDANSVLQERELIKLAALGTALAETLVSRGVAGPTASVAAETGIAVFKIAFVRWVHEDSDEDLPTYIREGFIALKALTALD